MVEVVGIDELLLRKIDEMRQQYRACSARQLANIVGYHHTYVSQRLVLLKAAGKVGFDAGMPGSIHRVGTREISEDVVVDSAAVPVINSSQARLDALAKGRATRIANLEAKKAAAPPPE
jgi:hypothetical protein